MLNKTVLKSILNVKHTAVDDVTFLHDGSIAIHVHATKGERFRCPFCGRKCEPHGSPRPTRFWRSLDWNTHKVFLAANSQRVTCPVHGVHTERVPWAEHKSRYTVEFEEMVAYLAVHCSKKAVSHLMRISWNSVGPICSRMKDRLDKDPAKRFEGLTNIGVDETSYKKGHKYITIVVNHDTGKVIWAHEKHGKAVFEEFFKLLTPEQLSSIKLVSGDGARWIAACIDEYCPNAERCIDPFHVVQWANEALDEVRKQAWRVAYKKAKAEPKRKVGRPPKGTPPRDRTANDLRGAKFTLGKSPQNLSGKQVAQLELIAKSNPRLYRAYLLKERLRLVFQMEVEAGMNELDKWIKSAQHCRIPEFVELQRKIRRHYEAIRATLTHGLSNARLEAVNNKVTLSIRMAYGFRNMDNLLAMVMLRCSDIKVQLPWEYHAA